MVKLRLREFGLSDSVEYFSVVFLDETSCRLVSSLARVATTPRLKSIRLLRTKSKYKLIISKDGGAADCARQRKNFFEAEGSAIRSSKCYRDKSFGEIVEQIQQLRLSSMSSTTNMRENNLGQKTYFMKHCRQLV